MLCLLGPVRLDRGPARGPAEDWDDDDLRGLDGLDTARRLASHPIPRPTETRSPSASRKNKAPAPPAIWYK